MNIKYSRLKKVLVIDEGKRNFFYTCPAGKLSIGIGRNIEDKPFTSNDIYEITGELFFSSDNAIQYVDKNGLSEKNIDLLFRNDVSESYEYLSSIFGSTYLNQMEQPRVEILVCMMFNLGYGSFLGFKNMIVQILKGNMVKASHEIIDSEYCRNVSTHYRAKRYADSFKKGYWVDYYD